MFDLLLDNLNKKIISHGGIELQLPQDIKEHYSKKNNSRIQSWLWDIPGFRRWRVTRMDAGNKLQVLNSVGYPEFKNDMPIFGVDLLWFGVKKQLVAILDFQPLIQNDIYFNQYFESLKNLKRSCPEFSNENNMRAYDSGQFFSPCVIFCRGDKNHADNLLPSIFSKFTDLYFDLHKESFDLDNILTLDEVRRCHCSYDVYNSERDPAHGLFKSYFGKEWSNRFLNEFLFPLRIS